MKARDEVWNMVSGGGPIDAMRLLRALVNSADMADGDARWRMLRRDAMRALTAHWGQELLRRRLRLVAPSAHLPHEHNAPSEGRFHTIEERIVDATNPDNLLQMLRELGTRISGSTSLIVGGSLALMLDSLIVRTTDDADIVDEIPAPSRHEHELLSELARRYGLKLAHFQSRYLPDGWRGRIRSLGRFGGIDAFLIDSIDILAGKLFSKRTKDLDDLRAAWPLLDQAQFRNRLARTTEALRRDHDLLGAAQKNWYILTGQESLPPMEAVS